MIRNAVFVLCAALLYLCISVVPAESVPAKHHVTMHEEPSSTSNNSWDLLLLVRVWPGYSQTTMPSNVNDFTIHGMWPERDDGSWPSFCDPNDPFDYSDLKQILPELNIDWYDSFSGPSNSTGLWAHEWDKHGTCAKSLPQLNSEYNFFNGALQLHSQINISAALASAGIVPSNDKSYYADDMNNALKQSLGVNGVFNCQSGALQQVYFCVDNTLKAIECNSVITNSLIQEGPCSSSIKYPPITH